MNLVKTTIAYKYALRQPVEDESLNWGDDCDNQFKLANEFWNTLVEIEHKSREVCRSIVNDIPELVSLNEEIKILQEELDGLFEEKKKRNKAARKNADCTDLDKKMKELKVDLKPKFVEAKILRKKAIELNKPELKKQSSLRFEAIKSARQAISEKGLWWGNYNAVITSFDNAVSRSYKDGGELRFKKYNGEGRITNQIINGISVEDLILGKSNQVKFIDTPWNYKGKGQVKRQPKQQYHLDVTIYANGKGNRRLVRFPIVYHRPLPEGAVVKMITIKRTKAFDRWKWFVVFTLSMEVDIDQLPKGQGIAVVNFGWRKTEEGIRIATVLRNGRIDYVVYPENILSGQLAGERNRGTMDDATNKMIEWLKQLPLENAPPNIQEIVATIRGFNKIRGGHFEWLRKTWEIDGRIWQPDLLKELQEYGYNWRLFNRNDDSGRRWVENARLYYYRAEVRRLLEGVETIIINSHDMNETANKEKSSLPRVVQHQRFITAPSVFRGALIEFTKKYRIDVATDDKPHDVCACHNVPFVGHDKSSLFWECPINGKELDQDDNFTRVMLQRYKSKEA